MLRDVRAHAAEESGISTEDGSAQRSQTISHFTKERYHPVTAGHQADVDLSRRQPLKHPVYIGSQQDAWRHLPWALHHFEERLHYGYYNRYEQVPSLG